MDKTDSDPLIVLRWAFENISLTELLNSSAGESFRSFLRRGTVPQLQQLLSEIQETCVLFNAAKAQNSYSAPTGTQTTSNLVRSHNQDRHWYKRKRRTCHTLSSPSRSPTPDSIHSKESRESLFAENASTPKSLCRGSGISIGQDLNVTSSSPEAAIIRKEFKSLRNHGSCISSQVVTSLLTKAPSMEVSYTETVLSKATQFFIERLRDRQGRLEYLLRAIQGIVEAPNLSPNFAETMWDSRTAIFDKPTLLDFESRLRNLYNGHRKIRKAKEQLSYAARFCYIYLEHDLFELARSQDLVLSQGRGKITAAFELQAEILSTTVEVVKSERKAGRGYLQLLVEGGPGFILRLGCNVSTIWERKLSNSDIPLIIEFLRIQTPALYEDIVAYNTIATKALLNGFIAYGWTPEEIIASKSSLFEKLRRFVDLEETLRSEPAYDTPTSLARAESPNRLSESPSLVVKAPWNQNTCPLLQDLLDPGYGCSDDSTSNSSLAIMEDILKRSSCMETGIQQTNGFVQISELELESILSAEIEFTNDITHRVDLEVLGNSPNWNDL